MKRKIILAGLITILFNFISCSNKPTEEEKIIIENYTTKKTHDPLIFGKWVPNDTFEYKGTINKDYIDFSRNGINRKRMYKDGEPFNDWHFAYYYFTKNGKIYFYRPSEKGLLPMDDEIFIESEYEISKNRKTLTLNEKIYKRME